MIEILFLFFFRKSIKAPLSVCVYILELISYICLDSSDFMVILPYHIRSQMPIFNISLYIYPYLVLNSNPYEALDVKA